MEVETREVIGETFDAKFGMNAQGRREGAFEIASLSISASSNKGEDDDQDSSTPGQTPGKAVSGAAAAAQSQTTIKSFTVRKGIDRASSDLFLLCCQQKKIQWAVITFREAGDPDKKPWLVLEFTDLYLDEFSWEMNPAASGDEVKEQETVKFSFGTILVKYTPQAQSGEHQFMTVKGWNRHKHATDPVPDLRSETW
jgi:type VI protein secretion system component Hcp